MYAFIAIAVLLVATNLGTAWKAYHAGADSIQTAWDRANSEARDAADAQRRQEQAKAKTLSQRLQDQIATQRQVSATLSEQLDAALKKKPVPLECVIDDIVRDNLNASLAGKGAAGAKLPATSPATAPAKNGTDG